MSNQLPGNPYTEALSSTVQQGLPISSPAVQSAVNTAAVLALTWETRQQNRLHALQLHHAGVHLPADLEDLTTGDVNPQPEGGTP